VCCSVLQCVELKLGARVRVLVGGLQVSVCVAVCVAVCIAVCVAVHVAVHVAVCCSA